MAENADQMLLRVEMMADDTRGVKWDLSPNDIAALRHVLATLTAAESAVARLTAERDEAQALVVDQRGLLLTMKGERDAAREQLAAQTPVIAAIEQGRCESLPEFVAYARRKALREAAGVPSKVIADLRRRGLLTAGDESVARSIESGILALIGASESESGPPRRAETIFGCRTCGASTKGWSDGRFAATGWRRLDHIDGPNAICLTCAADPTALDCLRDEYPNVTLASESGEGGSDGQP